MKKNTPPLEWYRVMLIIIGAFGIVMAFINWYTSGNDIPNGLLTILSLIISAALGPNAVSSVANSIKKTLGDQPTDDPTEDESTCENKTKEGDSS